MRAEAPAVSPRASSRAISAAADVSTIRCVASRIAPMARVRTSSTAGSTIANSAVTDPRLSRGNRSAGRAAPIVDDSHVRPPARASPFSPRRAKRVLHEVDEHLSHLARTHDRNQKAGEGHGGRGSKIKGYSMPISPEIPRILRLRIWSLLLMHDDDLIPPNAPPCPHCAFPTMIPWNRWWECPRCDGVQLPDMEHLPPE